MPSQSNQRHIVFLQGMPCNFFSEVARNLDKIGCKTTGINLCLGDWFFWNGKNKINYRGTLGNWRCFIHDFLAQNHVSDVVLLGEQRNYHKVAIEEAHKLGVFVAVTDFGYLRPDWITLEEDGMNGNSKFPKDMDLILKLSENLPEVDLTPKYEDSNFRMSVGDITYNLLNMFDLWFFPKYIKSDNRPNFIWYLLLSIKRLIKVKFMQQTVEGTLQKIFLQKKKLFILPLQLDHDFAIMSYSNFSGMYEVIAKVIKSFAKNSDENAILLIKAHPLDMGKNNWQKIIDDMKLEYKTIANRVYFVDGGNLGEMLPHAYGVIVVNSTSGIQALLSGCAVKTLGTAIYDIKGLTFDGELDEFWQSNLKPNKVFVSRFINLLVNTTQIKGVFFASPGSTIAINSTVNRLFNRHVGKFYAN